MSDEPEVTVVVNDDDNSTEEPAPDRWAELMSSIGELSERIGRLEAAHDRESEAVAEAAAEAAEEAAEVAEEAAETAVVAAVVTESVAEETAEEAAEEAAEEVAQEVASEAPAPASDDMGGSSIGGPDVEAREWEEPAPDDSPAQTHWLHRPIKRKKA